MTKSNSISSMAMLFATALLFGSVACDTQGSSGSTRDPGSGIQLPPDAVGTEYLHVALGEQMEPEALFAFLRALFDAEASEKGGFRVVVEHDSRSADQKQQKRRPEEQRYLIFVYI